MLKEWGLDESGALRELALLATAAPRDTSVNPVLSAQLTPRVHIKMRRLFVGFAHGLLIESMVSRLATVERIHKRSHSLVLYHLFMHKCRQAPIRKVRLAAAMRSSTDGGLRKAAREEAAKGKPLKGSANSSKAQKLLLLKQTEAAALQLKHVQLLKRGQTTGVQTVQHPFCLPWLEAAPLPIIVIKCTLHTDLWLTVHTTCPPLSHPGLPASEPG